VEQKTGLSISFVMMRYQPDRKKVFSAAFALLAA
jgi:hypothetical protein